MSDLVHIVYVYNPTTRSQTKMPNKKEAEKHSIKNLFNFIVFKLLKLQPMQANQIIDQIDKNLGVNFEIHTITPILNNFEAKGAISDKWDLVDGRPHKIFTLTEEGKKIIDSIENELNARYKLITDKPETAFY
jgi:DNA-binding PadR family transcriptional regulator